MQIWDFFEKSISWQIYVKVKWENTRFFSGNMSLEEVLKMAQTMELAIGDVAQIKNKDTEDCHKMWTKKADFSWDSKWERLLIGLSVKWHEKRLLCSAWGKMF